MTVETLCRDCVFAEYEDNVQVECKLHQLERLVYAGAEIEEVKDDEKEFYVVHNIFCRYWRNRPWLDKHKLLELAELREIAREEMKIHYEAIVYANESLDDIKTTVES